MSTQLHFLFSPGLVQGGTNPMQSEVCPNEVCVECNWASKIRLETSACPPNSQVKLEVLEPTLLYTSSNVILNCPHWHRQLWGTAGSAPPLNSNNLFFFGPHWFVVGAALSLTATLGGCLTNNDSLSCTVHVYTRASPTDILTRKIARVGQVGEDLRACSARGERSYSCVAS